MNMVPIFGLLLITCALKGAAFDEKKIHIFNATKNSALFLRLYKNTQPHTVLRAYTDNIKLGIPKIFKLPSENCINITHDFQHDGNLRLRIWSELSRSKTQKNFHIKNAFRGQIIKSKYNAFIILNKCAIELPLKILTIRGYTLHRRTIYTPNRESLIILKTTCSNIEIFKSDLKHALNCTEVRGHIDLESYSTIGTFKVPDA